MGIWSRSEVAPPILLDTPSFPQVKGGPSPRSTVFLPLAFLHATFLCIWKHLGKTINIRSKEHFLASRSAPKAQILDSQGVY